MTKEIVAVVGAGLMGGGIAQVCVQAGYTVYNIDLAQQSLDKAKSVVQGIMEKRVAKGKLSESDKEELLSRLNYSTDFNLLAQADIIIEAVPENIEIKKSTFEKIDMISNGKALMISNTSGLSISEIASATKHPENVMGVHFFYPAPVMKLVELIRGIATTDKTYEKVKEFSINIGKEVVDAPELPGFIVNRILVPMMNEAAFLVMEGCKPSDVDAAMKLGANHPMGPLELCDFVGIDVMLATMNGLYEGFKDSKFRPCPILENMVKAGHCGRKTGKGFYTYDGGTKNV